MIMAMICVGILLMLPEGKSGNLIAVVITVVSLVTPDTLPFIDEIVMMYMTVKRFKPTPVKTESQNQSDDYCTGEKMEEVVKWD